MEVGRLPTVVTMIARTAAGTVMALAPPRSSLRVQRAHGTIIQIAQQPEPLDLHRYIGGSAAMAGISTGMATERLVNNLLRRFCRQKSPASFLAGLLHFIYASDQNLKPAPMP